MAADTYRRKVTLGQNSRSVFCGLFVVALFASDIIKPIAAGNSSGKVQYIKYPKKSIPSTKDYPPGLPTRLCHISS